MDILYDYMVVIFRILNIIVCEFLECFYFFYRFRVVDEIFVDTILFGLDGIVN